MMIDC
jgi:hypothetical protein